LTPEEKSTGWYAPDSEPGSSVNVINGKIVSYVQMRDTYRDEFVGNSNWHDKEYVENWWENIRHAN